MKDRLKKLVSSRNIPHPLFLIMIEMLKIDIYENPLFLIIENNLIKLIVNLYEKYYGINIRN